MDDVDSLGKHIYETLRDKFILWREPHITTWNWACQKRLQDIVKR
jgi:hypothetical protein